MIIAKLSDGTLVLGVFPENIRRLESGSPIRVSKESHGINMPDNMPRVVIARALDVEDMINRIGEPKGECRE